ncbi:MAG: GTPase Era [Tissierellia bacterium]|nr:GTPase Era [Tissierellia bacterium]
MKSGYVTILGRPNVGKSTLLNMIIGEKLSIISDKPQTTRERINLIYNDDDMQIIFIDTPGMQNPRNKLGTYMLNESKASAKDSDVLIYMTDNSDYIGRQDTEILEFLKTMEQPIICVINKIDIMDKKTLAEIMMMYSELQIFSEIIPISSLNASDVKLFMNALKKYIPDGPRYYPEDYITDKSEKFIVSEIIREKTLKYLRDEIPHGIAIEIEHMKEFANENKFEISATIFCERESHKGMVIGKGGQMIKKIRLAAKKDIELFLNAKVFLELYVKVEKDWRQKDGKVKSFGYK